MAFGEAVDSVYDFSKADMVFSLDADFLQCGPGNLRYAADFMARRRAPDRPEGCRHAQMNRLYVVETAVSCTGAKADHRLALRAGEIEGLARAVAAKLGVATVRPSAAKDGYCERKWIAAVAKDWKQIAADAWCWPETVSPPVGSPAGTCDERAAGQRWPDRNLYEARSGLAGRSNAIAAATRR